MIRDKNSNIIRAELKELLDLGYSQAIPEIVETKYNTNSIKPPAPGSLLCLTSKSQDLWAELSPADIRNSRVNCGKFLILEK